MPCLNGRADGVPTPALVSPSSPLLSPVSRAGIAYCVYFAAYGASWPYLPVYYQSLGLNLAAVGALAALAAGVQVMFAPVWGALSDRLGNDRGLLLIAPTLAACASLALAQARLLPMVAASVIALNAGLAGIMPMLDARTLTIVSADRTQYGRARAWGSASAVLTVWLVGVLVQRTSPAALFCVSVPAFLLTALATLGVPPRALARSPRVFGGGFALLRQRELALFLAVAVLVWAGLAAADSFYSLYIISVGGSAQTVGIAWAIASAVEVPIMWVFPAVAVRVGTGRLLVSGAATFALRAALAVSFPTPEMLVVVAAAEGIGFALFYTAGVTYVARHATAKLGGTAQGLNGAAYNLGIVLGSMAGGLIAEASSLQALFGACAVGGAIASVAVWCAVRGEGQGGDGGASAPPYQERRSRGWTSPTNPCTTRSR